MHRWSITESYLARKEWELTSTDNDDACRQMQTFADAANRNIGTLIFDDYSDEIHAFFVRKGRRRVFMRIQYEGLVNAE